MIKPFNDYDLIINTTAETMSDEPRLHPMPTNYIINKVLTGWGATYSEIKSNRNSIIILPHVSQIYSKHKKHEAIDNTFPVTEKKTHKHIVKYLKGSTAKYKKFLCTPEGLEKLIKAIEETGVNPFTSYFLLVDEFHKITLDVGYRVNISSVMKHFFNFTNKAMISSTPLKPSDPRLKSFIFVKVQHEREIKKDITLSFVNNLASGFREYLENYEGKKLFVFFNSLNGIHALMMKNNLSERCNIYCSADGVKDFQRKDFQNAYNEIDGSKTAEINFLTSSFFNGLDIEGLDVKPDVVMITDYHYANQSLIDPNTDAYQILGRFRKYNDGTGGYNTATHIINVRHNAIFKLPQKALEDVELSFNRYETLCTLQSSSIDPYLIDEVYGEAIKRLKPFNNLLDDDGELDWFKLDNYIYEEKVKMCYGHDLTSGISYYLSKLFNIKEVSKVYLPEEFEKMSKAMNKYNKDGIIWAYQQFIANENQQGTEGADNFYHEMVKRFPLVAKAIKVLGYETIESLDFSQSKIKKALIHHEIADGRLSHGLMDLVYTEFIIGIPYELATVKAKLQGVFDAYGLMAKAKGLSIGDYYEFETYYGHKKLTKKETSEDLVNTYEVNGKRSKSVRMVKLLRQKYNTIAHYSTRAHKTI